MHESKKKSVKQEKALAKKLKGRTTPASGALTHAKGDVRSEKFLCECKTTEKDKFSLKYEIWNKINKEALRDGMRIPLLEIEIKTRKFILFHYKQSGIKPDKHFSFQHLGLACSGKSRTLSLESLVADVVLCEGKIPVWKLHLPSPYQPLLMMEAEDFHTAINVV